jgi:uncharacterized protein (TIGR03382 family)
VTFTVACPSVRDAQGNLVANCVQLLPGGFALSTSGAVTGRRDSPASNTVDHETFNFLVEAADTENRTEVRAFSLDVRTSTSPPSPKHGCGCGGPGTAPVALIVVARALRRRRKANQ